MYEQKRFVYSMLDGQEKIIISSVENGSELYKSRKNQDQVERIEAKLQALLNDKQSLDPSQVGALMSEAAAFDRLANFSEKLADYIEKNKQEDFKKKKEEEIKHLLMEKMGIPAEFIAQLGLLVKAGPEALREGAQVYRAHASNLREQAEFVRLDIERVDKQIKALGHVKEIMLTKTSNKSTAINEYLAQVRYQESLRDKADLALKEALQQIEDEGVSLSI